MIVVLDVMSMNVVARKTNLPISPFRYRWAVEECFTFFFFFFFPLSWDGDVLRTPPPVALAGSWLSVTPL